MIRTVLAVVVAGALLAAALPAVETARTDRTHAAMERSATRLVRAAENLLATDAADAGARRVLHVRLPAASYANAGVERLVFGCERGCHLRYRLRDGAVRRLSLDGVPLAAPAGEVVLSRPGRHRLVLGAVVRNGTRRVSVAAPG